MKDDADFYHQKEEENIEKIVEHFTVWLKECKADC
jgi:hypothetical protein